MSQLDTSLFFSHLTGLVLLFFVFLHFTPLFLINFWLTLNLSCLESCSTLMLSKHGGGINLITKILAM